MNLYFSNRTAVAAYVADQLTILKRNLPLIMTITLGKSEDFSVSIATVASLEDTELQTAKFFSDTQVNT